MSKFLTDLVYRDNHGETWTLTEALIYQSDLVGRVIVPVGTVTDLASIPDFAQNLISKVGPWDRPAVIHDTLYTLGTHDRATCDKVLLEAMVADGVGVFKRNIIYYAVRLGGWKAWRDHLKERIATGNEVETY